MVGESTFNPVTGATDILPHPTSGSAPTRAEDVDFLSDAVETVQADLVSVWARILAAAQTGNNLTDLASIPTARSTLGITPEPVYTNASASGSVPLQNPATTKYTIQRYEVPNSDTLTLSNPTATAGVSMEVQIETGTGTTVVFPTSNTRWSGTIGAAGTAPTVPASSVTKYAVECVDGTHWDWAFVGRVA